MNSKLSPSSALILLVAIFSGGLVIASVLANKIVMVWRFAVPAGVLAYSITFPVTDVVGEIWGRRLANWVVLCGFLSLLAVMGLIQLALVWPAAPFWQNENAFASVLGMTRRIIIASFTAYLISQWHDVWAFHFWKNRTRGRWLWLRNNLSTAISQLLDSIIFITVAFYGTMPPNQLIHIIGGQYFVKVFIAAVDTPVVYGLVFWIRRKE